MANKVRVTALFLVLAILIATFGAVSVVQAKTVGDVEKLEIIEEGQQTDCTLRWHRVKGADGYQIFQSVSDKKAFDKFAYRFKGKPAARFFSRPRIRSKDRRSEGKRKDKNKKEKD